MKSSNKMCLLMFLLVLGTCNISANSVFALEEPKEPAVSVQEEAKTNIGDLFDNAVEAIDKKDYQSAIVYLTNYITVKPKKYEAYKLRGDAFYALRQYVLAQQDYQTAISIKSDNDKFITGTKVLGAVVLGADKQEQLQNPELGNLYARLMYAQKALNNPAYESSYAKAFEYNSHIYLPKPKKEDIAQINCPQKYGKVLNPQGADAYIYGAIDDIANANYNEAIYKAQYLTVNYPKFYLGYYLTGVSMVGLEKEKDAIPAFETALKYNPYDFESLASLGQIYYQDAERTFSEESAKKSIEYFNKALDYNPNCYLYYYYIGLNELQTFNLNSAISSFNNAIKFKSSDYNSIYYKLIAQYIAGDYEAVIEGATRMLYRHVSNYNSVLYLRALAYNKLGNINSALADLEKIQNGVDDIYNADIKIASAKEKTLDNYIYYLKAQIMQEQGFGAKADMAKALQNPIIAKLSSVEKSLDSFEEALNSSSISFEDYNKYNNFYSSELPKLLASGPVITAEDVENQYDYIRTTFDNLGISFKYLDSNYKLTTVDNFVEKKYSPKLADNQMKQNTKDSADAVPKILKQSTDQMDTLASDSQSSIAQMLATSSLGTIVTPSVPANTYNEQLQIPDRSEDVVDAATVDVNTANTKIAKVTDIQNETKAVNESSIVKESESTPNSEEIGNLDSSVAETSEAVKSPEYKSEGVKIIAEEIKQTPDIVIEYPEAKQEIDNIKIEKENTESLVKSMTKENNTPVVSEDESINKIESEAIDNMQGTANNAAQEVNETPKVVEKHADVDLNEFDFVHKPAPVVDETTDVVNLDSKDLPSIKEDVSSATDVEENIVEETGNKPVLRSSESVNDNNIYSVDESEQVIIPETETEVTKDKKVAVPVVLVPEISKTAVEKSETPKKTITKLEDTEQQKIVENSGTAKKEAPAMELRPQTAEASQLSETDGTQKNVVSSEKVTNLKSESSKKIKPKKEKAAKSVNNKENNDIVLDNKEQKKSFWRSRKSANKDDKILSPEKTVKAKSENENVIAEKAVESDSVDKVKETKSAKKLKTKQEVPQTGEELISSFVQSTFGSASNNTVEKETPADAESLDTPAATNSKEKITKVKSKKSKNVENDKNIDKKQNSNNEEVKSEKFSFKRFFAKFKKGNSSDKSVATPVEPKEQKLDTENFLPLDEIQSEVQSPEMPVDLNKKEAQPMDTIESGDNSNASMTKKGFKSKRKKEQTDLNDESVMQEKSTDEQLQKQEKVIESRSDKDSVLTKREARKKEKELKKLNSKIKKESSKNSSLNADEKNNTVEDEGNSSSAKKPSLREKHKTEKAKNEEAQVKQKVHVASPKDTYEIYVKDDKQRKIIKQMEK